MEKDNPPISSEEEVKKENWVDKLYLNSIEYIVNYRKHLREYALAILVVLFIRSTVGVVYQIPTGSMIPTFKIGDTLLANRFYYGLKVPFTDEIPGFRLPAIRELAVGDIAIFRGPREEVFRRILLTPNNSDDKTFINELNQASAFKGIIDHDPYDILDTSKNFIITAKYADELEIRLHDDIYQANRERLDGMISEISSETIITPYRFHKPLSFFRQVINTPLAGISMIATVLARTPYFYLHGKILTALFPKSRNNQGEITFYPNHWIDTTKEYVKRVIAKGGDKVEVREKVVYVNDQKLAWHDDYQVDPDGSLFVLTREDLPHSPFSAEKMFSHPLRFSPTLLTPDDTFDAENWPYDVETRYASQFRDHFGPIIVPPGHYFMMGDNRDESLDSRYIGTVPAEMISGTPMLIFYPWSRRGIVE